MEHRHFSKIANKSLKGPIKLSITQTEKREIATSQRPTFSSKRDYFSKNNSHRAQHRSARSLWLPQSGLTIKSQQMRLAPLSASLTTSARKRSDKSCMIPVPKNLPRALTTSQPLLFLSSPSSPQYASFAGRRLHTKQSLVCPLYSVQKRSYYKQGTPPQVSLYTSTYQNYQLLRKLVQDKKIDASMLFLEKLHKTDPLVINDFYYSAIMSGCDMTKRYRDIISLVDQRLSRGTEEVAEQIWVYAIRACTMLNDLEKAEEYLALRIASQKPIPVAFFYTHLSLKSSNPSTKFESLYQSFSKAIALLKSYANHPLSPGQSDSVLNPLASEPNNHPSRRETELISHDEFSTKFSKHNQSNQSKNNNQSNQSKNNNQSNQSKNNNQSNQSKNNNQSNQSKNNNQSNQSKYNNQSIQSEKPKSNMSNFGTLAQNQTPVLNDPEFSQTPLSYSSFSEMEANDISTLGRPLIHMILRQNAPIKSLELIEKYVWSQLPPEISHFNTILHYCSNYHQRTSPQEFEAIRSAIAHHKLVECTNSALSVISYYTAKRDMQKVNSAVSQLQNTLDTRAVTFHTSTMVFSRLAEAGMVDTMEQLWPVLGFSAGWSPGFYGAILKGLRKSGNTCFNYRWLKRWESALLRYDHLVQALPSPSEGRYLLDSREELTPEKEILFARKQIAK